MSEPDYLYKVVLAGDARVGKTSIRQRYLGKGFESNYLQTLGADFANKTITKNQVTVQFQIWDISGQPTYEGVRQNYYLKSNVIIFVFALNDTNSFYNIYNWLTEFSRSSSSDEVLFFLLGNKVDLETERQVQKQDINAQIKLFEREFKVKFTYYETSALSGQNIDEVFEMVLQKLKQELN